MLVLSRKSSEEIAIGPEVTVKILEIRGDRVRLGITAPKELVIRRGEIADEWVVTRNEGEAA